MITRHIVFHGHHECKSPVEFLDSSFHDRKMEILDNKPSYEHPIRFALFKNITHLLPIRIKEKLKRFNSLNNKSDLSDKEFDEHGKLAGQLEDWVDSDAALRLHAKHCKCEWAGNHRNILFFDLPKKKKAAPARKGK